MLAPEVNVDRTVVREVCREVMEEMAPTAWLSVKEAAEYLALSYHETYRRIQKREIPAYSLGPQGIRLDRRELDAWLRSRPYG